jgi:tetratricopeptide (TPR) repeat protein
MLVVLSVFFISSWTLPPPSWGQSKPVKMPIQKPAPQASQKPVEKKEAVPPPVQPEAGLDLELEMKKTEALIRLNDKNAAAYFNRAWLYEYKGDMQRALQDYSKAIELDKGMKDAFYNRGVIFTRMKRFEEAVKDFSQVIKLEPSSADAYCNRGTIHFQMGKVDLALDDYNAGLKAGPEDADLLYNRALVYLAKGDKTAAAEDLKKSAQRFHDRTRREFPELASQPPAQLKKAALEGQVSEFLGFMPEDLRQRVQNFEATRIKVEKAVLEFEKKAKQSLGEKFRRQGSSLAFSITGTDPRWMEIFGPRWPEMIQQKPNEPRFFYMSCEFAWKEEIHVLQRLQACLESPSYCQEAAPQNSALHLKRVGGAWMLVDGKNPEEWKQVLALGEGLVGIIQWADQFISGQKGKVSDEEMLIGLAKGYMQKVMELTAKPKKS